MAVGAASAYTSQMELFGIVSGRKIPNGKDDGSQVKTASSKDDLTPDQQRQVEKLKQRDQDVRAHEQAHMAAGGAYVKGGATFQYQQGPDGKLYAVGGEVSIDTSPVKGDPQATIAKMETIKAAALAPADPSGQDRSVAAEAEQTEAQARRDESSQQTDSSNGGAQAISPNGKSKSAPAMSYSANGTKKPLVKTKTSSINVLA
jgi:SprA-related family